MSLHKNNSAVPVLDNRNKRIYYQRAMSRYERQTKPLEDDPVKKSLSLLEKAVEAIQDSDSFRAHLDAQARFHRYSWGNVMLIMMQRPDATRVAGYRTWESMDRHVKKGEKGIRIIAPAYYKKEVQTDEGEEEEERTFFRSTSVFDISQTEGKPLAELEVPVLEGEQGAALYGRLEALALTEGLAVQRGHERLSGTQMGFYLPEEHLIAVREAPQRQMTKTLAHELGHHFAQHQSSGPASETEAEGVAYVVLAHFGVDSGERSFPYVATWAKDKSVLKAALANIQRVSSTIIERLQLNQPELSTGQP